MVVRLTKKRNFEKAKIKKVFLMRLSKIYFWLTASAILFISCKSHQYQVTHMSGTIIEMNSRFDENPDQKMAALIQSYKIILDKEMNEVIGQSTQLMEYGIPESLLTNFTSDAMKQYGDNNLPGGVDLAVMNVHGHRATMPKGEVTLGNLYEIYSFDNTITFLELKGEDLNRIFDSYAQMGGAGISSNVRLEIKKNRVSHVTIDGKEIDPNKIYKIATLDYLADGNNGMEAFLDAQHVNNTGITLRDIMIAYVRAQTKAGKALTSALDGRITNIQ